MMRLDLMAVFLGAFGILGLFILKRMRPQKAQPALPYSQIGLLQSSQKRSFKLACAQILPYTYFTALLLALFAFFDPYVIGRNETKPSLPVEGRALFLLIDRSGSMGQVVDQSYQAGQWNSVTKLERLKQLLVPFVEERSGDLFGLVAFARSPQPLSPLTWDHGQVIQKIQSLQPVQEPIENGTAIGYAIYKTASLIAASKSENPFYKLHDPLILIFTDGLQDPNPLDLGNRFRTMGLEEASTYAKENGIKVYMVNFEPRITEEKFKPNLDEIQRAVEITGGKLILSSGVAHLQDALKEINLLEKSSVALPDVHKERTLLFSYFLWSALIIFSSTFAVEELFLRRIP